MSREGREGEEEEVEKEEGMVAAGEEGGGRMVLVVEVEVVEVVEVDVDVVVVGAGLRGVLKGDLKGCESAFLEDEGVEEVEMEEEVPRRRRLGRGVEDILWLGGGVWRSTVSEGLGTRL